MYHMMHILGLIMLCVVVCACSIISLVNWAKCFLQDCDWCKGSQSNTHFSFFHKGDINQSNKDKK